MNWSPEDGKRYLDGLEGTRRAVTTVYRIALITLIAAVLFGVALLVTHKPAGFGSQGEWFYVGLGVVLILGWAVLKLITTGVHSRDSQISGGPLSTPPSTSFPTVTSTSSSTEKRRKGWSFNVTFRASGPKDLPAGFRDLLKPSPTGENPKIEEHTYMRTIVLGPQPSHSKWVEVGGTQSQQPTAGIIAIADALTAETQDWDEICRRCNPQFYQWNDAQKREYKARLIAGVQARKAAVRSAKPQT